jgi:hypothetical protein
MMSKQDEKKRFKKVLYTDSFLVLYVEHFVHNYFLRLTMVISMWSPISWLITTATVLMKKLKKLEYTEFCTSFTMKEKKKSMTPVTTTTSFKLNMTWAMLDY